MTDPQNYDRSCELEALRSENADLRKALHDRYDVTSKLIADRDQLRTKVAELENKSSELLLHFDPSPDWYREVIEGRAAVVPLISRSAIPEHWMYWEQEVAAVRIDKPVEDKCK